MFDAVAADEGRAFLFGEGGLHLLGDPLFDVDDGVVEQRLRRRRHGVELHRRESHVGELLIVGLRARIGFRDPSGGGSCR